MGEVTRNEGRVSNRSEGKLGEGKYRKGGEMRGREVWMIVIDEAVC